MATKISLDTITATNSLKGLTSAVSAATSSFKANSAMLASAGDMIGSYSEKVSGLSKAMELQQSKIDALRSRQEGLDVTTQSGAEQYQKLEKQIATATRQMASMESQQERAKNSLSYYTSGLADLQHGYETAQKASQTYVSRLEAEGKQDEANQARMSGLKQSLSNLSSQYETQESELQKIASTSGVTSEAYLKQKTRLDETGTAVAETNSKISKLNSEMKESHSSFLSGVRSKLDSVNEKASKTSDLFWKITGAHLLANGITSALQSIQAHFSTLIDSAKEYDVDQQKLIATWTTLTGSSSKAKDMQDTINSLAIKTGQATDTVNELEQGFYHLHSSKSESDELTKSMLNMSDAVGLNSQQIQAVTQDMVNGLSRGKANAGMLNQISQYFPMFREQLAKYETQVNHGKTVTVADLTTMAKQGKISSQAIETVFNQLGSGKYDKAADNMLQTMYGMERTIKSRMPALLGEIYEPIMQMKNPLIGQVSKWTTSEDTKKAFSGVGQALAMQISDIMTAFGGKKINISSNLDGLLLKLQTGIDKLGATIVAHKSEIKSFINSFKSGSSASLKVFVDVLKDMAVVAKPVLDLMAKFPKTTASIVTVGLLASRAITAMSLAFKGLDIIKSAGTLLKSFLSIEKAQVVIETIMNAMNPFAWVALGVAALAALTAGFVELYKHNAKVREFVNGIVKSCQQLYQGITKWFGQAWNAVKKGVSDTINFVKKNWAVLALMLVNPIAGGLVLLYNNNSKFRKWANDLWTGVKNAFVAGWNASINVIKSGIKLAENLWNSFKTGVKNTVTALGRDIVSVWNAIKNFTVSIFTATKNLAINIWIAYENTIKSICTAIKTAVISIWNGIKSALLAIANGIWNGIKLIFNELKKWSIDIFNGLKTGLINIWNAVKSSLLAIVNGIWTGTKNVFTTLKNWSIDIFNGLKTGVVNIWNGLKSSVSDVVNGIWNGIKSVFTTMYDWLNKITGGRLGDILNTFKSIFSSISGVISGAVKAIHTAFVDVVRGIATPFNELLSGLEKGINWVLDKVGASKIKATWSIPLPAYASGTGGVLKDQLAMVNDGKGSDYREMYHTPDGQIGMFPAQRNMIVPLKAGTEILDGNSSARLASLMGFQKYASGSIGSFFSGIFNKGKDLLEDADKIIAHPAQFLESVFSKFAVGIKTSTGLASDIITNFPSTIAKSAVSWIKKIFSDDVGNIKGTATPTQAKEVIEKAMGLAGVSGSNWLNGLETIAKYESGFRNVTNNWDSNAKAGHPSSGWFQMIKSTFEAYAKSGYGNWTNPLDQAISAIGYIKSRYGGIGNVPGIKSLARGGKYVGYANGGVVSAEGLYTLAEGNKPEFVIPTDYTKHNRAVELLNQAKTAITGTGLDNGTSKKLDTLIEQNSALISLVKAMLTKKMDVNFNGKLVGELYPEFDKQGYVSNSYQQRNVWG
jgi:tape measure domain-containing protein